MPLGAAMNQQPHPGDERSPKGKKTGANASGWRVLLS
jgi:hypothetical protein